jgi:nitric oxide reductase NorQ protein
MISIELDFPPPESELEILRRESGLDGPVAESLIKLATAIRRLQDTGLREVASTRTLIAAAALIAEGVPFRDAALAAIAGPLTDDAQVYEGLATLVDAHSPRDSKVR